MADDIRIKRIESQLREEISSLILKGIIKDPRVSTLLTITGVKVSKDTAYAKIYISGLNKNDKEDNDAVLNPGVEGLNHAAGFIQAKIGKTMRLRNTPKLTFYPDHSIARGIEMIKKIEGLNT